MQQCKVLFRYLFAALAYLAILKLQIMQRLFPQRGHVGYTAPGRGGWTGGQVETSKLRKALPEADTSILWTSEGIEGAPAYPEIMAEACSSDFRCEGKSMAIQSHQNNENCCYDYLLFMLLKLSPVKCEGL
ncbi:UNVERIFIED_CONTAM: hypothetical protein K2H54_049518 [Gekko kuhli]